MNARLEVLAASLVLASAHALAVAPGKPDAIVQVALTTQTASLDGGSAHRHVAARSGGSEEDRLYPIRDEATSAPSAASKRAGDGARNAPGAKKGSSPEPGSWAMILAGLLGVGAIARRRMSA